MMDASSDDENEEGFDVVPVVEADGNTDLTDLLEQALVPRMAAVQVQEGTDTFTIPASFARAASPPPSTRRRMQRDDSSTRTSAAPSEVRESAGSTRYRSNSFTAGTNERQILSSGVLSPQTIGRSYTSSVSMTDSSWQNGHKVMVGDDDPISEHSKDQHQTYISASLNNTEGVACGNAEIPLVVGGRRFLVNPEMFEKFPETMLSRMFSSSLQMSRRNEQGDHVLDYPVSPEVFAAILNFYRTGKVYCPSTASIPELHEACNFFLVPFDHTSIECTDVGKLLHELSNKGAIQQFENFLKASLLPAMAKCAEIGDRKCHVVILRSEQTVEWDEEFPPGLGEQFAKALNRFLFSYENRNIARQLLKDKGLKKIKLGIEGFPTFVERTRVGPDGNILEVEYFYDQSPFIKASWEKEEQKSRHVDFQYVRTNTSTNVLSTIMTS